MHFKQVQPFPGHVIEIQGHVIFGESNSRFLFCSYDKEFRKVSTFQTRRLLDSWNRTFTFRGWNGILEFESRRNKSSTYFSFRTGKYFASQEAPFLLSRIKNPFMISIQMQKIGFQEIIFRSVHERTANSSQQKSGCVHQTNHLWIIYRIIYT